MEELAKNAALSVSAFHRQFKVVTALSPLQYQKQVRLIHARSLLVTSGQNATAIAHQVGYESATQPRVGSGIWVAAGEGLRPDARIAAVKVNDRTRSST